MKLTRRAFLQATVAIPITATLPFVSDWQPVVEYIPPEEIHPVRLAEYKWYKWVPVDRCPQYFDAGWSFKCGGISGDLRLMSRSWPSNSFPRS